HQCGMRDRGTDPLPTHGASLRRARPRYASPDVPTVPRPAGTSPRLGCRRVGSLIAGVDLGGTKIQTVVLDGEQVIGSHRVLTPRTGADDVVAAIVETIRLSLETAGADASDLDAIGIGSPGEIDADAGVVSESPNVPGFQEKVDLGPRVGASLDGVPVKL